LQVPARSCTLREGVRLSMLKSLHFKARDHFFRWKQSRLQPSGCSGSCGYVVSVRAWTVFMRSPSEEYTSLCCWTLVRPLNFGDTTTTSKCVSVPRECRWLSFFTAKCSGANWSCSLASNAV
jgi:hypothetical protein